MNRRSQLVAAEALRATPAGELAVRRAELQANAEAAGMGPDDIAKLLNSRPDLPRQLLVEEHAALMAVLDHVESDDGQALVAQAEVARVVGFCGCGCASVDLEVDRTVPAVQATASPLPVHTVVRDGAGDEIGGVIVFLRDGYLSLLEVYSWDQPISPIPPVDRLECF